MLVSVHDIRGLIIRYCSDKGFKFYDVDTYDVNCHTQVDVKLYRRDSDCQSTRDYDELVEGLEVLMKNPGMDIEIQDDSEELIVVHVE